MSRGHLGLRYDSKIIGTIEKRLAVIEVSRRAIKSTKHGRYVLGGLVNGICELAVRSSTGPVPGLTDKGIQLVGALFALPLRAFETGKRILSDSSLRAVGDTSKRLGASGADS